TRPMISSSVSSSIEMPRVRLSLPFSRAYACFGAGAVARRSPSRSRRWVSRGTSDSMPFSSARAPATTPVSAVVATSGGVRAPARSLIRAPCDGCVRARSLCRRRRSRSAISSRVRWFSGVAFTLSNLSAGGDTVDVEPDPVLTGEATALAHRAAHPGLAVERLELDDAVRIERAAALGAQNVQSQPPHRVVEVERVGSGGRMPGALKVLGIADRERREAGAHEPQGGRRHAGVYDGPAAGAEDVTARAGAASVVIRAVVARHPPIVAGRLADIRFAAP